MSACRSCGAPIEWARLRKTGRLIPLNPASDPSGNLARIGRREAGAMVVEYVKPGQVHRDPLRFTSHFATCPDADEHRKSRHV